MPLTDLEPHHFGAVQIDSLHASSSQRDQSILGNMDDDLARLYAAFAAVVAVSLCVAFVLAVAMAGANSQSRSSEGPRSLVPEVVPAEDLPISFQAQATQGWTQRELKVTCGGYTFVMAGAAREPFAEVFFGLDFRRGARYPTVGLTVDQMDFGMRNCCTRNCSGRNRPCHPKCRTAFVHKLTIEVRPKSWTQVDCHRLMLQPHHTAEVFVLQRNSSFTVQMPVCPRQASVSYQIGDTVARTVPVFGWSSARSPAGRDDPTVTLTLELHRFTNGTKIELDNVRWGSKPVLPIPPDHMHVRPQSVRAGVEWELQPQVDLQHLEFDVKINLHTAVFQRKRRGLAGYSVTTGPTVPFHTVLAF